MIGKKVLALTIVWAVVCAISLNGAVFASGTKEDLAIERIDPETARTQVESGNALLVCSYDDKTCQTKMLDGGLLRSEFEAKLSSLPKDQEIIFYCS